MTPAPITFTLDLEDYAPVGTARALTIVPHVLELLAEHGRDRHVLRRRRARGGRAGAREDDRGRGPRDRAARVPARSASAAVTGNFRSETARGRDVLEDLAGAAVTGYRADVLARSRVALGRRRAHRARLHVLVERAARRAARSSAGPGQPRHPYRWPGGLVELPCPVASFGPHLANPYLGGVYFRVLPWPAVRLGLARSRPDEVLWLYCHPYDFDPDEPFVPRGDVGRLGNRLLWLNRSGMAARIARVLAGRAGLPLGVRAEATG